MLADRDYARPSDVADASRAVLPAKLTARQTVVAAATRKARAASGQAHHASPPEDAVLAAEGVCQQAVADVLAELPV